MNTLDGKTVFITGAAGGLGHVLVNEFLNQGARVAAGFHTQNPFTETECLLPVAGDVTSPDQVNAAMNTVIEKWKTIDVLINNAGITVDNLSWKLSDDDWDQVLDTNLKGPFLCCRAVSRAMLKQRGGHIINITSFSAAHGNHGQSNYAAAKAGLIGLTESLARELGPRNVRVNALMPGFIESPMTAKLKPGQLQQFAKTNCLNRLNDPAEVARFIAFLVTTQNISGQVFQLDSRIGRWT